MNNNMKLYTEEQVREMLQVCQDSDLYEDILTFDDILKTQISIELPSDEEIDKKSFERLTLAQISGFRLGAKYVIDKIQGGNNEQQ